MQTIKRDGVPGYYSIVKRNMFNNVKYFPGDGTYELVASVPAGVYGSPGIKPKGNPDASIDIDRAIDEHSKKMRANNDN